MGVLNDFISALKTKIEQVTECFYQQKTTEGYQALIEVIDGISELTAYLGEQKSEPELMEASSRLLSTLQEVMDSMLNKDTVLTADILRYDITELLDEIMGMNL